MLTKNLSFDIVHCTSVHRNVDKMRISVNNGGALKFTTYCSASFFETQQVAYDKHTYHLTLKKTEVFSDCRKFVLHGEKNPRIIGE